MKFTITDCMSRINQALNYPALTYDDVSHFFDQAISELNTSLRVAIPTVSEMSDEHKFKISDIDNSIYVPSKYITSIESVDKIPTKAPTGSPVVYYVGTNNIDNTFYIYRNKAWKAVDEVYGITETAKAYVAIAVVDSAVWRPISFERTSEFSLTEYLPVDWIILFLIPYVCFKFSVRNGDNGALFSDEFTQGFQQLQTSYNVPNETVLSTVAHLPAYKAQVLENLHNLNVKVPTRAVLDSMRIRNAVRAVYGSNLFESGGWGI